ncbi:hypothetical protein [Streptosporangium vulgare]|uniref:hypothetical protein n=1 Tax=Streptosporangium vulgare TaxID=46190 RepID=UPI0031DD0772
MLRWVSPGERKDSVTALRTDRGNLTGTNLPPTLSMIETVKATGAEPDALHPLGGLPCQGRSPRQQAARRAHRVLVVVHAPLLATT